MKRETIYSLSGLYRDDFRITGYRFGEGEKTCCIIGSLRGDEIQSLYICSQLVKALADIEEKGDLAHGKEVLVIPSANNFSMNIGKRLWCLDNTDINRMFPGDPGGETTQRIAAGVFNELKQYKFGVMYPSFYIPGIFAPHIRMVKTAKENTSLADMFGLPYIVLRTPIALDRTTLNYNLQMSGTAAFSVYTGAAETINESSAALGVAAALRFLSNNGIIRGGSHDENMGLIVNEDDMVNVSSMTAGIFLRTCEAGDEVRQGDVLAQIIHPYEGTVTAEIKAPMDGIIFFAHKKPLVAENTLAFKMIKRMRK